MRQHLTHTEENGTKTCTQCTPTDLHTYTEHTQHMHMIMHAHSYLCAIDTDIYIYEYSPISVVGGNAVQALTG